MHLTRITYRATLNDGSGTAERHSTSVWGRDLDLEAVVGEARTEFAAESPKFKTLMQQRLGLDTSDFQNARQLGLIKPIPDGIW